MSNLNLLGESLTLSQAAGAILSFNPGVANGEISFNTPFGPVTFTVDTKAPKTKSIVAAGEVPFNSSSVTLDQAFKDLTNGYLAVQRAKLVGVPFTFNATQLYSSEAEGFATLGLIDINININF